MATRRTQPYRATGARRESPVLRAMQAGRPKFMHSPGDHRRRAMKRKRRRKPRARYRSPIHRILKQRSSY